MVKKMKGRSKGNKSKKIFTESAEEVKEVLPKKRGRPKGSKNKLKVTKTSIVKEKVSTERKVSKKLGRPRKAIKDTVKKDIVKKVGRPKKYSRNDFEELDMSNVKTFKFLGYCPNCNASLCTNDLEENKKTIFVCYRCNKRGRINALSMELLSSEPKPKSKKAFLEATTKISSEVSTSEFHIPKEFEAFVVNASEEAWQ